MRAVLYRELGSIDNLAIEQVPVPDVKPDWLRIKTHAAGLSFSASLYIEGRYQRQLPLPYTPGTEVAGIVDAVGAGVDRVAVGDRVMASVDWGGHGGYCLAHQLCTHKLPKQLPFAEAAMVVNSYATSYAGLVWKGGLVAGEVVLVHSAAGAIGSAAVQIAKALGATVIATAGSAERLVFAKAQGADHVLNYMEDDFAAEVKALTDGRGADLIFDSVGGDVARRSLRCLAIEGRLLTIGYTSGDIPELPSNIFMVKNASLIGLNIGTYLGWSPGGNRDVYARKIFEIHDALRGLYEGGKLQPAVSLYHGLEQFRPAMNDLLNRQVLGKAVIEIGSPEWG
ncbi:MAG: NADPH:quinone oxidoreductase family protein [Rhodospirillaceae bacterium]|jgi:NADPH2:quinone reductase|nr:NADPH:quinone oxidoreductase family protein [Rhodospirillaceae bacterium]MBT3779335.1 NADPH:quinone oxidoreductase family protein [Rhodospirillaceae bacterium]MBT3975366.1 NADPH:quinone oxidoreductase family protein [Rhodospirillaceae bacterium]MBT4167571.1 NADPH:quinone oxidoreductase family protein [Rhodospirillaceae bacterium]MBT4562182.1 NADPH:quinone oxidoreductase family protein [Rhodospirillaceae bacterium]